MRVLMKISIVLAALVAVADLGTVPLRAGAQPAAGHAVSAEEAAAVADLWLVAEGLSPTARQTQIWALVGADLLLPADQVRQTGQALAYVVVYQPVGHVVVAGDDRIQPVLAFAADAPFRWDPPERNFMRHYLNTKVPNRYRALADQGLEAVHPTWVALRIAPDEVRRALASPGRAGTMADAARETTEVLLDTAEWDQGQFYNATVVARNGNTAAVPTGCVATAMAIKMRFHQWPATGSGTHSYTDTAGSVQYAHSVTYSSQSYNWAAMPITDLTAPNAGVANLMYHAGVAMNMDYEVGESRAAFVASEMHTHFGYRGTIHLTANHYGPVRDSILIGLPVPVSTGNHMLLADGYRDTVDDYFHLNLGWGGANNDWYSLDEVPPPSDPVIEDSYPYCAPTNFAPAGFVFVDGAWGGTETGAMATPYNTVGEGAGAVPAGGQLWIKAGSYTGTNNLPITIGTAMTIHSWNGLVTIGTP